LKNSRSAWTVKIKAAVALFYVVQKHFHFAPFFPTRSKSSEVSYWRKAGPTRDILVKSDQTRVKVFLNAALIFFLFANIFHNIRQYGFFE